MTRRTHSTRPSRPGGHPAYRRPCPHAAATSPPIPVSWPRVPTTPADHDGLPRRGRRCHPDDNGSPAAPASRTRSRRARAGPRPSAAKPSGGAAPSAPPATGKRRTGSTASASARTVPAGSRACSGASSGRCRPATGARSGRWPATTSTPGARLGEFYMYGLLVLLVLLFVRNPLVQSIVPVLVMVAVLIMLVGGHLHRPPRHAPSPRSACPGRALRGCGCTPPCARCRSGSCGCPSRGSSPVESF